MRPSPKNAPAAVIGLDIGSDSIKIAEAKCTKDGITITGLGVARTPEGAVENEVITDPQALGRAIKNILSENGIKTRKCVSSVGGQSQVIVRIIEVPKMSSQELAETMKWEIERQVPFAANEVVKDFQPLEKPNTDPDAQNMEVLLAVAQQDLISRHVATLQAAGLKPMAIDVEPLAISRPLIEADDSIAGGEETVAIVNIGSNRTDMGIYENGLLTFPSPPLGIAGVSFTREIAESLGQSLEQAEVTKKEYAAVDLDAFAAPPADDQAVYDAGAQEPSEPTQFDTVFSPTSSFGAFEFEDSASTADAPASDEASSEPAIGDFQTTIDGPVFDVPDLGGGPAFDLGEPTVAEPAQPAEPEGMSFDLGGFDQPAAASPEDLNTANDPQLSDPLMAGPAFDLGGGDDQAPSQMAPDFDLDDTTPAKEEPAGPEFDLSDTDTLADPGEAVAPPAAPVAAASGDAKPLEEAVFQAISSVLVDLAGELRRSIEYYSSRYGKFPEKMLLCGGTAKMPKLAEFLSRELGMPVEVADPTKTLKVNVPAASPQYLKEITPLFSVSIGLAIRDMIG